MKIKLAQKMFEFLKSLFLSKRNDEQSSNPTSTINSDGIKSVRMEFSEEDKVQKAKKGSCGLDCCCFDCGCCE